MLSYLFIFVVGIIVIAVLKSLFRSISYEKEYLDNPDYISTIDHGRIVNFDTNNSELQNKPASN